MLAEDAAIDALHASWARAIRRGDVDSVLELLTADYVLWSPSMPAGPAGEE
jgi:ketosteroid isomerase-like protein